MSDALPAPRVIRSSIPARLDRLPWSGWHWKVVIALGITWMLDGLEVTVVGAVASVLGEPETLHLTEGEVGIAASCYLAGAILGALYFGRLTDRLGRKRLFLITLSLYLAATLCTALSIGLFSFCFFRSLTGAGIGGEYSAINSTIDELLPARIRGRADLAINSTYWLGTLLGAASSLVLLDPHVVPHSLGWRLCFSLGAILSFAVLLVRRHVPESPRWLLLHGREGQASEVIERIEAEVSPHQALSEVTTLAPLEARGSVSFQTVAALLLKRHPRRTALGLTLMIAQAFAYNAIFFTYALVLTRFYRVPSVRVGLHLIPFALANLAGPLILGHLFDSIGRRTMIAVTYGLAGVLLLLTGLGFARGLLTADTQTALWCAVFFVASSAASSAYLTVSEIFPVEIRGLAIALFYAVGTAVGGLAAPALFGALIGTGNRWLLFIGYAIGAGLMIAAALVAAWLGVPAERRSLEELATPNLEPAPT